MAHLGPTLPFCRYGYLFESQTQTGFRSAGAIFGTLKKNCAIFATTIWALITASATFGHLRWQTEPWNALCLYFSVYSAKDRCKWGGRRHDRSHNLPLWRASLHTFPRLCNKSAAVVLGMVFPD